MLDSSNLSLCSLPFSNYENAIKGINQTTLEVPNSYLLAVFSAFCILPKSVNWTKHPHSMCVMLCTLVRNRGFRSCKCSLVMSQFILVYFMVFSKAESTAKILVCPVQISQIQKHCTDVRFLRYWKCQNNPHNLAFSGMIMYLKTRMYILLTHISYSSKRDL